MSKLEDLVKEFCKENNIDGAMFSLNPKQAEVLKAAFAAMEEGNSLPDYYMVKIKVWGEDAIHLGPYLELPEKSDLLEEAITAIGVRRVRKLERKRDKKVADGDSVAPLIQVHVDHMEGKEFSKDDDDED